MTAEAKATPPVCKRHVAWRLVGKGLVECVTCGAGPFTLAERRLR